MKRVSLFLLSFVVGYYIGVWGTIYWLIYKNKITMAEVKSLASQY